MDTFARTGELRAAAKSAKISLAAHHRGNLEETLILCEKFGLAKPTLSI
jgi:hypothetical protein